MKRHQFSLAGLMLATAIFSIGLAIIHFDRTASGFNFRRHDLVLGVVPMGCVVCFGTTMTLIRLVRDRECPGFLLGFQASGWISLFIYISYCAIVDSILFEPFFLMEPIREFFFSKRTNYLDERVIFLHMSVLFFPQFAISVLGGSIARRLGLLLIVRPGGVREDPD